eukprot:572084-Pyramimonas_sp.AAC.1
MATQPSAMKRREINPKPLGDDSVKREKMHKVAEEEQWSARCKCGAAARVSGGPVRRGPGQGHEFPGGLGRQTPLRSGRW